jgi:ADP-ribosyl-[dinitrogen reductase] hydrolase
MLLELAIGDAYGMGFEYASAEFVRDHNNLSCYVKHRHHNIQPGAYTDDTQMSIAVGEAIISGAPWTDHLLADKFVNVFKRDPREGYAGNFYAFLQHVEDGAQFLAEIKSASDKSGAAMRACPVGIFQTTDDVIERCTLQARLTHDTPDGIAAANAAALMTHYFLYQRGSKAQLGQFLERYVPGQRWSEPWQGEVGGKGWMSVRAAITAVMQHQRLSLILKECIAFTGDVDTVAAIALGAASCSQEVENDLPAPLLHGLERSQYGYNYLVELDRQLLEMISQPL